MALAPGFRLAHFEIVGAIGAGGMGEVYRARDTRLGRDVAIKVLPADVAGDPVRLHRFEQEARAAAALNHSNILALFDIGHDAGIAYIVTELLDGQTLRQLLENETLAISRVVDLAAQIADGLAAAHARNIVHRDLKPENIFVTTDARAKILDFGLAKTIDVDAQGDSATRPATAPHTVLGTAGYMAPEQVRAQPVDHRTDVFAFGAVLYEMLSGRRAFSGDTTLDAMSAILRDAPATIAQTPSRPIPPSLLRIVDRCLEKAPAARFQSTVDLAFALKGVSHADSMSMTPTPASAVVVEHGPRNQDRYRGLPWVLAAIAVGVAGAAWFLPRFEIESDRSTPVISFTISPPPGTSFGNRQVAPNPAISADGRQLLFQTRRPDEGETLWIRSLNSLDARPLGIDGNAAFWSPDSRSIGFWSDGKLQRIDLESTNVRPIAETDRFNGAAWSSEDIIIFGSAGGLGPGGPLWRVRAEGGTPEPLTTLDPNLKQTSHRHPFFLPDGRRFLYQSFPDLAIWIGSLDGGPAKRLLASDSKAQFVAPDWVLFVRQSTLLAQRVDVYSGEPVGEAQVLATDVRSTPTSGAAAFTVSANILIYRTGDEIVDRTLVWLNRAGEVIGTVKDSTARYEGLQLFPGDREAIAVVHDVAGRTHLARIDLETGRRTKLTSDPSINRMPVPSPDGSLIAWYSDRTQPGRVFKKPSNGTGSEQAWIRLTRNALPTDWTKRWLILTEGEGPGTGDIWFQPVDGSTPPRKFLGDQHDESFGRLSADESLIVYQSNEGRRGLEVFLRTFPDPNAGKWKVSGAGGGLDPRWSGDGREIFYSARNLPQGAWAIMSVSVTRSQTGVTLDSPRPAWTALEGGAGPIAIASDGKRALVARLAQSTVDEPMTVVVNWMQRF